MQRKYHKWYSPYLKKEMELLVFGHAGTPVLFFPPRTGRFYDYENWKIIESISNKIDSGFIRIICLDSVDSESFYCKDCTPDKRILRHLDYENYLLHEIVPFAENMAHSEKLISAGCSLGAFHAVNFSLKYPQYFSKVLGMSGRYDLSVSSGFYDDLFEGYWDENIYFNMPCQYITNLYDSALLNLISNLTIVLVVGQQDSLCGSSKRLSELLNEKGIANSFHIWQEEAHKPFYWRKMMFDYI